MDYRARGSSNAPPGVSGFMLGLLLGAVVAGAVALLYAPRSGQELRNRFKEEANETQQMINTWMNDVKQRAESISQTFRTEMKSAMQGTGDGHKLEG